MSGRWVFIWRRLRPSVEVWAAVAAVLFIAGVCVGTLPGKSATVMSAVMPARR